MPRSSLPFRFKAAITFVPAMAQRTHLSMLLLKLFAKGDLSGAAVRELALAAWKDGWGRQCRLARLLARPNLRRRLHTNANRDVFRAARLEGVTPPTEPYIIDVPPTGATLQMYLPHEVFFHKTTTSDVNDWRLTETELDSDVGLGGVLRAWAEHDDVQFVGNIRDVGAVGLHCDGASYTSSLRPGLQKSIYVCSCNIVSGRTAAIREDRLPLFTLPKAYMCDCGCSGFHTLQPVMDVLAWSFRCLLSGVSPGARHDGSPWTGHDQLYRLPRGVVLPTMALLQVRGDWEWLAQAFRFRSYSSDAFCWMCNATKSGPLCYHDFTDTAAHRLTLVTHRQYLVNCAASGSQPSHLFRSPGLQLEHICVDAMHAGDLGTFQDAVGSLLFLEISQRAWHPNRDVGMVFLNAELGKYYRLNPRFTVVTPLTKQQLRSAGQFWYPTLRAKAAQTRHLAGFCLGLAHLHSVGGGPSTRPPLRFDLRHRLAGKDTWFRNRASNFSTTPSPPPQSFPHTWGCCV
jgi:hypothetical protein